MRLGFMGYGAYHPRGYGPVRLGLSENTTPRFMRPDIDAVIHGLGEETVGSRAELARLRGEFS